MTPKLNSAPSAQTAYRRRQSTPVRIGIALGAALTALVLNGCGTNQTGLGVNLVSEDEVTTMAQQSWQKMRSETPVSQNDSYRRTVDRVATRVLTAAGENPAAWEVVVFQGDQINAFALPGGKIGVYEGMMKQVANDDQLAAVIGHEIAHNEASHAAERVNSQAATQLGVSLTSAALGAEQADLVAGLLNAGAQYGVLLPYSRNQELEADRLGLTYMARAGYNPEAALTFWQGMAEDGGNRPPAFASTHPAPEQRIAQIRELLPQATATYQANR